jgi:Flp pilus assembly protein TadB
MNIIPDSLGRFIRFLIGILLLQGVTVLLVHTALKTDWALTWPLFALLGGAIGFLVALWFNTIVYADRHRAVSKLSERFSREREKIRVKAEQQRAKDGRSNERLAAKARNRASAGMSLKTGVVVGGTVGLGVAMMVAQFMTLGLITLTAAGGAALGYTVRVRQEKLINARRLATEERAYKAIDVEPPTRVLPRRQLKDRDDI